MKNTFKFLVGTVAAFAFVATTASAAYTHTGTLKLGSRSTSVMALQQTLNTTACKVAVSGAGSTGMETTYFGPATKAAVQCFQRANALGADGVVGAMTGAKLSAIVVTDSTLPAGCTSKAGYSTTTGVKCDSTGTTTTPTTPGSLKGGAGNLELTSTSKDVKSNVAEGTTEKVLGYKAKAEDSDLALTNVKVKLEETSTANGTYRVAKYFDEVSIWLGDKKVGSIDADDFNRDGRSFTKSIALSNAVIANDKEANLYVAVEALSTVDNTAKNFTVTLSDVRYTDATGAILSDSAGQSSSFGFKPEGADDKLSIKRVKSTADTLKVDADDESEEFTVMTFDLETGTKSGDVTVNEMFIDVTVTNGGATNAADVISYIEANGVEADFVTSTSTTARYSVDFDDDFVVDADDSEEVEIVVAFSAQDGNYNDNTKVSFKVTGSQIIAEGATDVSGTGTATSKDQTLSVSSATVSGYKWETAKTDTTAVIDFLFTVDADDEDYKVLANSVSASSTGSVTGTMALVSGDATATTGGWVVESGDVATFRVRYNYNTSGAKEVRMTSVAGKEVPQDKQLSPTVVLQ